LEKEARLEEERLKEEARKNTPSTWGGFGGFGRKKTATPTPAVETDSKPATAVEGAGESASSADSLSLVPTPVRMAHTPSETTVAISSSGRPRFSIRHRAAQQAASAGGSKSGSAVTNAPLLNTGGRHARLDAAAFTHSSSNGGDNFLDGAMLPLPEGGSSLLSLPSLDQESSALETFRSRALTDDTCTVGAGESPRGDPLIPNTLTLSLIQLEGLPHDARTVSVVIKFNGLEVGRSNDRPTIPSVVEQKDGHLVPALGGGPQRQEWLNSTLRVRILTRLHGLRDVTTLQLLSTCTAPTHDMTYHQLGLY
jgi:hypothetical protein